MVYLVFTLMLIAVFFIVLYFAATFMNSRTVYYNIQKRAHKAQKRKPGSGVPNKPGSETSKHSKKALDREIAQMRKDKIAEMEAEIAAEKKSTLEKLVDWADREEDRLQKRLNEQYQAEADKAKGST